MAHGTDPSHDRCRSSTLGDDSHAHRRGSETVARRVVALPTDRFPKATGEIIHADIGLHVIGR